MTDAERIRRILEQLPQLSAFQLDSIDRIIIQLQRPKEFRRNSESDLISDEVLQDFGDALRIHHVFSAEALSKDRFEYALERVLKGRGVAARRAPRGNPGHDITINNTPVSLKTQADRSIKAHSIHISKFMELGKGEWTDRIEDLRGLSSPSSETTVISAVNRRSPLSKKRSGRRPDGSGASCRTTPHSPRA